MAVNKPAGLLQSSFCRTGGIIASEKMWKCVYIYNQIKVC
jgi:hypothetical protein